MSSFKKIHSNKQITDDRMKELLSQSKLCPIIHSPSWVAEEGIQDRFWTVFMCGRFGIVDNPGVYRFFSKDEVVCEIDPNLYHKKSIYFIQNPKLQLPYIKKVQHKIKTKYNWYLVWDDIMHRVISSNKNYQNTNNAIHEMLGDINTPFIQPFKLLPNIWINSSINNCEWYSRTPLLISNDKNTSSNIPTRKQLTFIMPLKNRSKNAIKSIKSIVTAVNINKFDFVVVEDRDRDNLDQNIHYQNFNLKNHVNIYSIKTNVGWSRSILLNYGVKMAKTKYVLMWDADFVFHPKANVILQKLILEFDFKNYLMGIGVYEGDERYGSCWVLQKSKFMGIGGFDEKMDGWGHEETDLHLRMCEEYNMHLKNLDININSNQKLVHHIHHSDELRGKDMALEQKMNRVIMDSNIKNLDTHPNMGSRLKLLSIKGINSYKIRVVVGNNEGFNSISNSLPYKFYKDLRFKSYDVEIVNLKSINKYGINTIDDEDLFTRSNIYILFNVSYSELLAHIIKIKPNDRVLEFINIADVNRIPNPKSHPNLLYMTRRKTSRSDYSLELVNNNIESIILNIIKRKNVMYKY